MKRVELVEGIESSVLGFGCASVAGAVDKRTASDVIKLALELGINHFDLARSYGYGEAEKEVGEILKPFRKDLVIASKFGIDITNRAKFLKPLKPLARYFKNTLMPSNSVANTSSTTKNHISNNLHRRIPITSENLIKNLELSLKNLKTDYLDYYFIHEPYVSVREIEDILFTVEKLKKQGKMRAFGIAFMKHQRDLHENYLDQVDVLQYNNAVGSSDYESLLRERKYKKDIFFMPLKGGDMTLSPSKKLLKLSEDFPNSIILNSSFNKEHLKSNAELFS